LHNCNPYDVENKWAKAFYRKKSILRDTACRTCSPPARK